MPRLAPNNREMFAAVLAQNIVAAAEPPNIRLALC
jgi:hypothetical protein